MKPKYWLILYLIIISFRGYCLTEESQVSILTSEPGKELYTIFGHTAIRITDVSSNIDLVYNFGTFDFQDPLFFFHFVRGNLDYFLSITDYETFIYYSTLEKRRIHEQVLDFSPHEKQKIYEDLEKCYQSPERYYRYDFFYDNCATRVRDAILNVKSNALNCDTLAYGGKSFRRLLKPYLSRNYWIDFGVNLSLGKAADQIASFSSYMFLPDYIMSILDKSELAENKVILIETPISNIRSNHFSYILPWVIITILIISSFWLKIKKIIFIAIMTTFGLLGILLTVIQFITINEAFQNNYNILWTLPSFLVMITFKKNIRVYIDIVYLLVLFCLSIFWKILPQEISLTCLPWIILLISMLILDLTAAKSAKGLR